MAPQKELEISLVIGHPPFLVRDHIDWICWLNVLKGSDLHPRDHNIQIFTHTSNVGWDTHLEQDLVTGLWSDWKKRLHMNVLELKAVFLALKQFRVQCHNQTVLITEDNSPVVDYINKQGGTHLAEMCGLV